MKATILIVALLGLWVSSALGQNITNPDNSTDTTPPVVVPPVVVPPTTSNSSNSCCTPTNSFMVLGQGSVTILANLTKIVLGVDNTRDSASDAFNTTSSTVNNIITALQNSSVTNLTTDSVSLFPILNWNNDTSTINGFRAGNTMSFFIENARVGEILDRALANGANRIDSVTFVSSPDALSAAQDQALRLAVADGLRQGDILADGLGACRGSILKIEPLNSGSLGGLFRPAAADNMLLTVLPGRSTITSQLNMQIALTDC